MEQNDTSQLTSILFFACCILAGVFIVGIRLGLFKSLRRRYLHVLLPPIQPEYFKHIISHFPFFNRLGRKGQRIFEGRVQQFIDGREFISRGGIPEVTDEMKVLIAGSAVQLTFGYPDINFEYFDKILIYPDEYYSTITRSYHKGEVNAGGIIVLSWRSLKEGFQDEEDGIHLGLHEMAHALRIIRKMEDEEAYHFFDTEKMRAFDLEAYREIAKMTEGEEPSLFRDYGATSIEEFFSVSVEVFFEKPDAFFDYNPTLYAALAGVMKMDLRTGQKITVMD